MMDRSLRSRLETARDLHRPAPSGFRRMHTRIAQQRLRRLRSIALGVLLLLFVGWGSVAAPTSSPAAAATAQRADAVLSIVNDGAPSREDLLIGTTAQEPAAPVLPIALLAVTLAGAFVLLLVLRVQDPRARHHA